MSISKLSEALREYNIYPISSYIESTPVRCFQHLFPENYYSKDVEEFLSKHNYKSVRRGSDLPWWGKSFFQNNEKNKIMIISQDSLSDDAGSIVFWSQLYGAINSKEEYENYISLLKDKKLFAYNSWVKVYNQFLNWNINLDCCYITDASKVYKYGSYKDRDFDVKKSKELLCNEIEVCKPNAIILLGGQPLKLLFPKLKYSKTVEEGKHLNFNGIKVGVSPFITGQGHTQKNYKGRLEIASDLIKAVLK